MSITTPLLQLSKLSKIFNYQRFKSRIKTSDRGVLKLQFLLNDILEDRLKLFSRNFSLKVVHDFKECRIQEFRVAIDPELIPFQLHSFDLILSSGPLMFTNDIPGVLRQWYASLRSGGVFMATFFGEETLIELKECFFRVEEELHIPHAVRFLPTIATKDAGRLMQRAGFYLPTSDKTRLTLSFDKLANILEILKAMGGNILHDRSKQGLSKKFLQLVESEYNKRYSDSSGLKVTVDIVCMTGWAIERYAEERINQQISKTLGYI